MYVFIYKAPIYIDKGGNVGVDFLGYRASAGLGGLLTGDATQGGLHAEAGTPHGQQAAAGLGGTVDSEGDIFVYLFTTDFFNKLCLL